MKNNEFQNNRFWDSLYVYMMISIYFTLQVYIWHALPKPSNDYQFFINLIPWKYDVFISPEYVMTDVINNQTAYRYNYDIKPTEGIVLYHITINDSNATLKYNYYANTFKTTYIEIYRCYVSSAGGIALTPAHVYRQILHPEELYGLSGMCYTAGHVHRHFTELISVGYHWCKVNFGHCIEDFYQPLIMIPREIRLRVPCLTFSHPFLEKSLLDLFEIPVENRVSLANKTWAAVDKLYTFIDPIFGLNTYGIATLRLKKFFHEKWKLDLIKSEKYCFTNRPDNTPRHIHNLEDVVKMAEKNWPQIAWQVISDKFSTIEKCAKAWKAIRFVFAPVGSNIVKSLFMEEDSVVIAVTSGSPEWSIAMFCAAARIFELQYDGLTGDHHFSKGSPIDVNLAINMIKIGLFCVENKRWPNDNENID